MNQSDDSETVTTENATWVAAKPMVVRYDLTVGDFHAMVVYRPDDSDDTLPWMWSVNDTADEDFEEEYSWEASAEAAVAAAEEALRELIEEYEQQAEDEPDGDADLDEQDDEEPEFEEGG